MVDLRSFRRGIAARLWRARRVAAAAGIVAMTVAAGTLPAAAQDALGTAVAVRPTALGELGGARVALVNGNTLFQGQTIATDATGEVQIVFADDTRMVVGPNSTLVIETYLLQNATTVGNLTVNALGGSFRFISGTSPHENYHINTPTGTIGMRGTALDFTVAEDGLVYVIVFEGAVYFCNLANVCVDLEARCQVGIMGTTVAQVVTERRQRYAISRTQFTYAMSQWRLLDPFQVEDPRQCLFANQTGASVPTPVTSSGGPASGGPSSGSGPSGPPSKGSYPSKGGSSGLPAICEVLIDNASGLPIPQWVYDYCFGPGK